MRPPMPGCTHKHCGNCLRYALAWRERVVGQMTAAPATPVCEPTTTRPTAPGLFDHMELPA